MSPLKPALSFMAGETLSGYVSRQAKLHETTPRGFCTDLGMRWPFLCSGHDDQVERLAWLTGEPLDLLRQWRTLQIETGHYMIGKAQANIAVLRRTALRLCPQCVMNALSETGPSGVFQMLEWSILSIKTCEKHGCPLITLPSSKYSHTTYDFVSRVLEHLGTIRRANETCEALKETSFEEYVRKRIWSGPQSDWLNAWNLNHIHRASLTLGAALNGHKGEMSGDLSANEERSLCEKGFQCLEKGEGPFKDALVELHRASTTERPYYSADMGPFYYWLREAQSQPVLAEVVEVARDHVFETYPTPTGKSVFGKKPKVQKWLTIDEARRRLGCGAVFMKQLMGHMKGVSERDALKRTDVHIDEISQVESYWKSLVRLKHAASDLAISPQQVKSLQNLGILSTIRVTSSQRYLKREEIDDLLSRVSELPDLLPGKSTLPIKEFCRAKGVHLTRVINLWIKGDLHGMLCRGEGQGLQAIEVVWDALCEKPKIQLDRDLKLTQAASYLQISVISIRQLRDHGYLEQIQDRNPDTNHLKSYITEASIRRFEQKYITLGQMAALQKVAPIHLARRLDQEDIEPVSCGSNLVRVYRRHNVFHERDVTND